MHREFGIVLGADPLVAKDAADLVDLFDAADQQPLEVQFQGDPQVEVDVERVVMRHERPGRRPAGDGVQRRRLDFTEAAVVEVSAASSAASGCAFARSSMSGL